MPCVSFAGSNPAWCTWKAICHKRDAIARLAQSVEREALNLVVVGSSPMVGTYRSLVLPASKENFGNLVMPAPKDNLLVVLFRKRVIAVWRSGSVSGS